MFILWSFMPQGHFILTSLISIARFRFLYMCICLIWSMRICSLFLLPCALGHVADEVAKAIQESRKSYGLSPLEITKSVVNISRDRAEELAESYEKYSNSLYLKKAVEKHNIKMIAMGENNGKSRNKEKNGMDIFEEWLKSEKHRKNIVKTPEYTHLGVYTVKTETNLYISAVFFQIEDEKKIDKKKENSLSKPLEKETASDLVIRSSHMDRADTSRLNLSPQSMLIGSPNTDEKVGLFPPVSNNLKSKEAATPVELQKKSGNPFTIIQLLYPNSVDVMNLSKKGEPIQFVYQQSGAEVSQKIYPQTEEGAASSKSLTLNTSSAETPKILFSAQNANPNQSTKNANSNTTTSDNSNPNPKTIIKLIMIQPTKTPSNSTMV